MVRLKTGLPIFLVAAWGCDGDELDARAGSVSAVPQTAYIVGDCNSDGQTLGSVTDGVFQLNWLFESGPEPACEAACDANGDGQLGGTADATHAFNVNFLGAPVGDLGNLAIGPMVGDGPSCTWDPYALKTCIGRCEVDEPHASRCYESDRISGPDAEFFPRPDLDGNLPDNGRPVVMFPENLGCDLLDDRTCYLEVVCPNRPPFEGSNFRRDQLVGWVEGTWNFECIDDVDIGF